MGLPFLVTFSEVTMESNHIVIFASTHGNIPDTNNISKRMMTSLNGNIFTSEFSTQRPVTRSFDVLFDLRLNKRLSK